MAANPILTVENLSVAFDGALSLERVSFTLGEGETLAVIGPNGAGKTVLFRALLGLIPYTGRVVWRDGVRIGYVPQEFAVERSTPVTALEFCLLDTEGFWRPSAATLKKLNDELALVGLDSAVLRQGMGELSGGQTQRLLLASAMLRRPDVLLLDEPTAGVDAGFEETLYALLHRLQTVRGTAMLLISHDHTVVYRYAQRVLCLNKTIVCQGPPVEAMNSTALQALYGTESGFYRHEHGEH